MKPIVPTVLLIEKDDITLDLYQRELSKSFRVIAVTELGGVMSTLAGEAVSAVVIEPEICAGQGWEMIDSIRAAVPGREIPVIVCTTRDASPADPPHKIARYLTKPVLPQTLRKKTLEVLRLEEEMNRFV